MTKGNSLTLLSAAGTSPYAMHLPHSQGSQLENKSDLSLWCYSGAIISMLMHKPIS